MVDLQSDDGLDTAVRAAIAPDAPPADFAHRVLHAAAQPVESSGAWKWYLAIAAAVLLGVWMGWPEGKPTIAPVLDPMKAVILPDPATIPAPAAGVVTQGTQIEVPLLAPPTLEERLQAALDAELFDNVQRLYETITPDTPDANRLHRLVCEHAHSTQRPLLTQAACAAWAQEGSRDERIRALEALLKAKERVQLFDANGRALTYDELLAKARQVRGWREAKVIIKAAIRRKPNALDAYALGCRRKGRSVVQRQWCMQAIRLAPNDKIRTELQRRLNTLSAPSKAVAPLFEGMDFEALMSEAKKEAVKGNRAQAVALVIQARKLQPDSKLPDQMLCGLLPTMGQMSEALRTCRSWVARERNPGLKRRAVQHIQRLEDLINPD